MEYISSPIPTGTKDQWLSTKVCVHRCVWIVHILFFEEVLQKNPTLSASLSHAQIHVRTCYFAVQGTTFSGPAPWFYLLALNLMKWDIADTYNSAFTVFISAYICSLLIFAPLYVKGGWVDLLFTSPGFRFQQASHKWRRLLDIHKDVWEKRMLTWSLLNVTEFSLLSSIALIIHNWQQAF